MWQNCHIPQNIPECAELIFTKFLESVDIWMIIEDDA